MTHTTEFNHEFSNSEKKLSLKERFVKYITSRESAEVFNNALAAMNIMFHLIDNFLLLNIRKKRKRMLYTLTFFFSFFTIYSIL